MKKQKQAVSIWAEAAGWYGMAAILGAYTLVSFNLVDADSATYQMLNLTGALGIIWISVTKQVWQSVTLNLFWCAIAIVALISIIL